MPEITSQPWKSRPVFITSTFRDMHAERDYLRSHVFPEFEGCLRQRHGHLETIDLRWGVETISTAETQAKELLVLKVCLNEIERCGSIRVGDWPACLPRGVDQNRRRASAGTAGRNAF
jgi:hypothetical protein